MTAYYNEIDPYAAEWLRNLIAAGEIAPGDVDERSIEEVSGDDLEGYTQCHFFAGIGGWSYALRLAGWPDERPVWTGSVPCQPFSVAGKGAGTDDPRHLWPELYRLIRQRLPEHVIGEQVPGAIGRGWLDGVSADLEKEGYAVGSIVLGAHSVGAPHIRQRLWWVAYANGWHAGAERLQRGREHRQQPQDGSFGIGLDDATDPRRSGPLQPGTLAEARDETRLPEPQRRGGLGRMAHGHGLQRSGPLQEGGLGAAWAGADYIHCLDGKARPVGPGIRPLAARFSDCLAALRTIEDRAWEEIERHGSTERDTHETLRMVRETVQSKACRDKAATAGMCQELHEASVLLDFLLCLEAARHGTTNGGGWSEARDEAQQRLLRSLWDHRRDVRSSHRREPEEQCTGEPSDALFALSRVLARDAETYRAILLDTHAASGRAGVLRGAGNAIVPQTAAEFIRAFEGVRSNNHG